MRSGLFLPAPGGMPMSLLSNLAAFGLRQVMGDGAENVTQAVADLLRDHGETLPRALHNAHERAWQALGIALAGDGLLDRLRVLFSSGDDKGIRQQVNTFLQGNTLSFRATPTEFRQTC